MKYNQKVLPLLFLGACAGGASAQTRERIDPIVDGDTCQDLLSGETSTPIGTVCTVIEGGNIEVTITVTDADCLICETHICNLPSEYFRGNDCVRTYVFSASVDSAYDFICSDYGDESTFTIAGHAVVVCDAAETEESFSAYYEIDLQCPAPEITTIAPNPPSPGPDPQPINPDEPDCDCAFPDYLSRMSLVVEDNALLSAHTIYRGIAIGGELTQFNTNNNIQVGSNYADPSFVYSTNPSQSQNIEFKNGVTSGLTLEENGIDFEELRCIASKIQGVDEGDNGYKVVVLTKGGSYSTEDFRGQNGQGEDNGKTLVVFNTAEPVVLTKTSSGRQFGPSVLAPYSEVTLANGAGFADGWIVGKSFKSEDTSLQMHGDYYKVGPICFDSGTAPDPIPEASTSTTTTTTTTTTEAPVPSGGECCSSNYKTCDQSGWCAKSAANCGNCNAGWIDPALTGTCLARYAQCTNDRDGCCAPGTCEGDDNYKQCK